VAPQRKGGKRMDKWCESWEKNFDTTIKALSKMKDDLKNKPSNLNYTTHRRFALHLELLAMEVEEMKENFGFQEERQHQFME
jgi:hypothetical protein